MLIIHKRKKSFQDLNDSSSNSYLKNQGNNSFYLQNNKKNYSLDKKTITSSDKSYKYDLKKIKINSPQTNNHPTTKYNSVTFNHFPIQQTNNQKGKEDNIKNRNNSNMKDSLINQHNISDINIKYSKSIDKPFSIYNNIKSFQNKNKRTPISISLKGEINNKYPIGEDLNNRKYVNHQTKSTKISNYKTLTKDKSQEDFKKRMHINYTEPILRNENSIYYTHKNKTLSNEDKLEEDQNNYNNHKLYESINIKRKNNNNKSNNINISKIIYNNKNNNINKNNNANKYSNLAINNNIVIQNKRSSNSRIKENEK